MAFHLGQRVIALSSWPKTAQIFHIQTPVKFNIYTIRAFCPNSDMSSLLLEEIINTKMVTFVQTGRRGEPSFAACYFRPLYDLSSLMKTEKELENV